THTDTVDGSGAASKALKDYVGLGVWDNSDGEDSEKLNISLFGSLKEERGSEGPRESLDGGRVPMRSLLLVLLLIGIQAVLNMEGALGPVAANYSAEHHTAANGRAEQQRTARLSVSAQQEQPAAGKETQQRPSRTRHAHRPASLPQDRSSSLGLSETGSSSTPSIPEVDPKRFSKRRYRSSPRVVFSNVP
ncbi:hypothetical protein J4Q44_G00265040, partial [Coregonus suidteri]